MSESADTSHGTLPAISDTEPAALSEEDAAFVEAVLTGGMVAGPRAAKLRDLLSLLDGPADLDAESLGRVTYLRTKRLGAPPTGLGEEDAAAVDRWLEGAAKADGVRVERVERLMDALGKELPDPALAERTFAAVAAARTPTDSDAPRSLPFTGRLADVIGVAAAAVVGIAVVLPTVSAVRGSAMKANCMGNLQASAFGFGQYANDFDNMLPVAGDCVDGSVWANVGGGAGQSNSANLFQLVKMGYTALEDLACPGNEQAVTAGLGPADDDWRTLEEVSYSYRVIFGAADRARLTAVAGQPILSDRSPILLAASQRRRVSPEASSPNHRSTGQHMVFGDGQVAWRRTPVVVGGDNAWLPRDIEDMIREQRGLGPKGDTLLIGNEVTELSDVFLGP